MSGTLPHPVRGITAPGLPLRLSSRRPIAGIFRATARRAASLCVRHHISADLISFTGLTAAATVGACLLGAGVHAALLLVAPVFLGFRLWLNMLDGMVALAARRASARGWMINELSDRLADLVIFIAAARSGLCLPALGYGAAIASLSTAYAGVLGEAVGVGRVYGGWMAKPMRMLLLGLGCIAELELPGALNVCLALIIAGCVQTVVARLRAIEGRLRSGASGTAEG